MRASSYHLGVDSTVGIGWAGKAAPTLIREGGYEEVIEMIQEFVEGAGLEQLGGRSSLTLKLGHTDCIVIGAQNASLAAAAAQSIHWIPDGTDRVLMCERVVPVESQVYIEAIQGI